MLAFNGRSESLLLSLLYSSSLVAGLPQYRAVLPVPSGRHRCVPHGVESRSHRDHHTLARHGMCDALPIVPTLGCGRPSLLSLVRAFTLGSDSPPDGCCCVSRRGCPPSSSHYHLPPRIPPLELTAEPSRPALYRSGCGRAEETKPHVLCGCAIRPVRWWRWQKMRLPISNMHYIARNMEPARPASVGSCRAWGFPNPQRLCCRSMIRSVAGVLAWW